MTRRPDDAGAKSSPHLEIETVSTKTRLLSRLAFVAALLVTVAGCHGVEPVVEFEDGDKFALLPLAEQRLGFFESPIGAQIVDKALEDIEEEIGDLTEIVPSEKLYGLFDDENIDPTRKDPKAIAEHLGANVYAVGRLTKWQLKDPGAINMLHGVCEIDLQIFRRSKQGDTQKLVWRGFVRAQFPDDWGNDFGSTSVSVTEDQVRAGLIRLAGKELGKKFYEWEPPEPGESSKHPY